jgi:hypothetical protein
MIHEYCVGQIGFNNVIKQEHDKITKNEEVTRIA